MLPSTMFSEYLKYGQHCARPCEYNGILKVHNDTRMKIYNIDLPHPLLIAQWLSAFNMHRNYLVGMLKQFPGLHRQRLMQ